MAVDTTREGQAGSVRSVERTFDLLAILEASGRPMRVSELVRAAQMPKATVQRLLGVLEGRDYIRKDQGRYRLWVATLPLASSFLMSDNLSKSALPMLQELAAVSEETVSLYVRLGFQRVLVQRVEGKHPLRYVMPIGQRLPLYYGAGRVLAAAMGPEELEQLMAQQGEMRLNPGEVLSREQLLADLDRIRRQGYWVSSNEGGMGTIGVSAPVPGPEGIPLAAVLVLGPADSMTLEKAERLSCDVQRAARAIAVRCNHL